MTFGSMCSGIEAATVAWHPLGWRAAFFAEIDKFPSALLAHHYPKVPNLGDFTKIQQSPEPIDLLVGGTPCQAFSVAGRRGGLDDPRGYLTLEFLALAGRLRPRWIVWENVPGVLSIDQGRTFGAVLHILGQLGYGFAYRVLDAQYFGVPQRRRRVFVVGCLGNWRTAAAVLFERESLRGYTAPSREAREGIAPTISARTKGGGGLGTDFDLDGGLISHALNAKGGSGRLDYESETLVAHSLRAEGFDASEDGTGRGVPIIPIAFSCKDHGADAGDTAPTLRSMGHDGSHANAGGQVAIAFTERTRADGRNVEIQPDLAYALTNPGRGGRTHSRQIMDSRSAARRLTPRECERLQGFPDDYTLIPYRGKPAADGPRYKALGNSMAVPCMRWIGERIDMVDRAMRESEVLTA